jgi:hypothetical protein
VPVQVKRRSHRRVPGNEAKRDRLTPRQVKVPAPPVYDESERTLRDEQQVARVELLMVKGIRDRRQLMALLEVDDPRQMDRYMARVRSRWELYGSTADFAQHRGEGLARLDLIESELWSRMQNSQDDRLVMAALRNLLEVQRQRADLLGLSPKVIEHMVTVDSGDDIAFSTRIATHDKLARLLSRMMGLVDERLGGKVIEHAPRQSD